MKKIAALFVLVLIANTGFSQMNRYEKAVNINYQPLTMQELATAPAYLQQKHDNNEKRIDALIDWVLNMKSQSSDQQVQDKMDSFYKKLRAFDGKPLAQHSVANEIRDVELEIKEYVANYNAKVQTAQNSTPSGSTSSTYSGAYVCTAKINHNTYELKSEPKLLGTVIYICKPHSKVYVLETPMGSSYAKIYIDGYTGYIVSNALTNEKGVYLWL